MSLSFLPAGLVLKASTFRFRLGLALIVAALLPLLLLGGTSLHLSGSYLAETVRNQHQATMNAFRGGISLFFRQRLARLNQLAHRPELQSLSRERIQEALPDFLSQSRFFISLGVVAADGNRLGMANRGASPLLGDSVMASVSAILHRALTEALSGQSREGRIIAEFPPTPDGQPILLLHPIPDFLDASRVVGVLLAEAVIQSEDLQEILSSFPTASDTWICLLDRSGAITARHGSALAPEAVGFDIPRTFTTDQNPPSDSVRTVEVDHRGRTDLVSVSALPELGGLIVVGRQASEAFRLVRILREHLQLIVLFSLLAACALGFFLSRMLSEPVIKVTEGIELLRLGVYSHRLEDGSPDEIGDAARALNALSAMLQKKMMIGSIWERLRGRGDQRRP